MSSGNKFKNDMLLTSSPLHAKLTSRIHQDLIAGTLIVPSLPEIVTRINQAINDPKKGLSQVSRIIQADPAIAGRLIQICNSPSYRRGGAIDNCVTAVMQLGLEVTRNIITCLALHNVFNASTRHTRSLLQDIWRRSAYIGAISYLLGKMIPGLEENKAMLAGLIHDIGFLPVFHYANELDLALDKNIFKNEEIVQLSGQVGRAILLAWKFPDEILDVPVHAHSWLRDAGQDTDYADVVIVARAHECLLEKRDCQMPPILDIPAFKNMSLSSLGPDASLELITAAREDIQHMVAALMSPM